jgi:hypothetical protein
MPLRPDSVVPPAPARPPPSARRGIGVVVAVLVLVAAVAVAVARGGLTRQVAATGRPDGRTVPAQQAESPDRSAPGPGPTSPPPAAGPAVAPIPPAGYDLHHEPGAYWISLPAGWEADKDQPAQREWFGRVRPDLSDLLFVTVRMSSTAAATALDVLAAHERSQRQGHDLVFYHRVALAARPRLPGSLGVADLEYTDRSWSEGAQTWHFHTMIRAVMLPGHRLCTVKLMVLHDIYSDPGSTEQDWQRATPTVGQILASLRLDAGPEGVIR